MFRSNRSCRFGLVLLWLHTAVMHLALVDLQAQQTDPNSNKHKAIWDQATLVIDSAQLSLRRVRQPWPFECRAGNHLIRIKGNVAQVLDFSSLQLLWEETGSDQCNFRLIGEDGEVLYLVEEGKDPSQNSANDLSVLRRTIATGFKLPSIQIAVIPSGERGGAQVIGAITKANNVCVLTVHYSASDDFSRKPISYQLTKITDTIVWSQGFASAGALETPGAFILGTLGPARDGLSSQTLVDLDSQIIVNAGPLEDVLAIDSESGQTMWRIPKIWEYRRGFIGPSVWSYYLGRYGLEDDDIELAAKTIEKIKEEGDYNIDREDHVALQEQVKASRARIASEAGWILAGPVAINNRNPEDNQRIFLITAQSDGNSPWSNYLASAVVYELNQSGEVIAMVTVPRLMQPDEFVILSDRVVWSSTDDATLELFPTPDSYSSDTFIKMNWKTATPVPNRKAWLRQGGYYRTRAMYSSHSISLNEGGYLEREDSQVINLPMVLTHLVSGDKKEMLLRLPFEGKTYTPTSNYSHGPNGWVSFGLYLFTIAEVQVDETALFITIQNESRERTILEFDVTPLLEMLDKK